MENKTPLYNKILLWFMTALTSIAGYVAVQSRQHYQDLQTAREFEKTVFEKKEVQYINKISELERDKDSLNGKILDRTDQTYKEFKELIDVRQNKSTITITPKNKK